MFTLLASHRAQINAMFSFNNMLYTASHDHTIKLYNPKSGWVLARSWEAHTGEVLCLARYKRLLISGGTDMLAKVWKEKEAELVKPLFGHGRSVTSMCVVKDKLVTGSADGSCFVWDAANDFTALGRIAVSDMAVRSVVEAAGYLVTAGADHELRVFNPDDSWLPKKTDMKCVWVLGWLVGWCRHSPPPFPLLTP